MLPSTTIDSVHTLHVHMVYYSPPVFVPSYHGHFLSFMISLLFKLIVSHHYHYCLHYLSPLSLLFALFVTMIMQDGWNQLVLGLYMSLTTAVLYVIPIQNILGELPDVSVGDTWTIPYHLRNFFPGAPGDRKQGAGHDCRIWFVNSWGLGWSRDM
jgi:hypothetical protein